MDCKIDGCWNPVRYTAQQVCQKHYFRFMRNGTYELLPKGRQMCRPNAKGYVMLFDPAHPLAMKDGYVYEHRKLVFDLHGQVLPDCEICGAPTLWETCHIDHRDEVVTNNAPANLRPLCRGCNTARTERATIVKYEHAGRRLSLTEWAVQPEVTVGRECLVRRIKSGMPIGEALFAQNKTHPKRATYRAKARNLEG